jgi:hypothetical protein
MTQLIWLVKIAPIPALVPSKSAFRNLNTHSGAIFQPWHIICLCMLYVPLLTNMQWPISTIIHLATYLALP